MSPPSNVLSTVLILPIQALEITRNTDMCETELLKEVTTLERSQPGQKNPETIDPHGPQTTETKRPALSQAQVWNE